MKTRNKRSSTKTQTPPQTAGRMRLAHFLGEAGVASRRHAEELILAGRVLVNGAVVDTLPAFVDPAHDKVIVDGSPVRRRAPEYFLLHKPKGVVCTNDDPDGRPRAVDLMPPNTARLYPVGRLDADSSGLLLMTNDGELAQRVTHPRFGLPKRYRVEVRGRVSPDLPELMRTGVHLAEGKARASEVEIVHRADRESVLVVTLREGRNRQVRRMLARLGHPVRSLKRVQIGPLSLRGLPVGGVRRVTPRELQALRDELDAIASASGARHRGRKGAAPTRPATGEPARARSHARLPASRPSKRAAGAGPPRTGKAARGGTRRDRPKREGESRPRRRLVT